MVCNSNAASAFLCDITSGSILHNGDDAIELTCDNTTLDVIGQIGTDPGSRWGTGLLTTQDDNLQRDCSVLSGDADGSDPFDPADEPWIALVVDEVADLGTGCP